MIGRRLNGDGSPPCATSRDAGTGGAFSLAGTSNEIKEGP